MANIIDYQKLGICGYEENSTCIYFQLVNRPTNLLFDKHKCGLMYTHSFFFQFMCWSTELVVENINFCPISK